MSSTLISLFRSQTNGAADGTGVLKLVDKAKALLGNNLPQYLVDYTLSIQMSIFGDYPSSKDIAPSAIFLSIFIIFTLAHLYIFTKNMMRGHRFWLSLLFAFYCFLRFLGFTLRVVWAKDILKMKTGIASEIFIVIPVVILAGLNLILAQRIFTWRHPHLGSTKFFWANMITTYAIVTGVVVMAIIGSVVPYIYFLSEHHFKMCKQVNQAASVLCVLFSLLAIFLVAAAYLVPSSKRDVSMWTYQPWWVESFGMWYFVPKDSAKRAEKSFKERDDHAFNATRIIASTHERSNQVERVQSIDKSGKLGHNHSILIIALTTLILLISTLFRCVSTFIEQQKGNQSWIFEPVVMYIMFGVLEVFINILYLTGRVDLRFYRPDRLKKSMRGSKSSNVNQVQPTGTTDDGSNLSNIDGEKATTAHGERGHMSSSDNVV